MEHALWAVWGLLRQRQRNRWWHSFLDVCDSCGAHSSYRRFLDKIKTIHTMHRMTEALGYATRASVVPLLLQRHSQRWAIREARPQPTPASEALDSNEQ